jgi:hypothetical protein
MIHNTRFTVQSTLFAIVTLGLAPLADAATIKWCSNALSDRGAYADYEASSWAGYKKCLAGHFANVSYVSKKTGKTTRIKLGPQENYDMNVYPVRGGTMDYNACQVPTTPFLAGDSPYDTIHTGSGDESFDVEFTVLPRVAANQVTKKATNVNGPSFHFSVKGDDYYVIRPSKDLKSIEVNHIPRGKAPEGGSSCFQEEVSRLEERVHGIEPKRLPERLRVVEPSNGSKGYLAYWGYLNLE